MSIPQVVYTLIVAAYAVQAINRLKIILEDTKNSPEVRWNVLSCIITYIHAFLLIDSIINKCIVKKKNGEKVIAISELFKKS